MKKLPFVWEIGCEEIPASWLPPLIEQLRVGFTNELSARGLDPETVEAYGTLRRLVIHVPKLADKQDDRLEQITGPPVRIARDEDGQWTQAGLGFARKNGIAPAKLRVVETEKGSYVGFEQQVKGPRTISILPEILTATLRSLSFPKFMNWDASLDDGKGAFPFGRPVRWLLCLFGNKVVPFRIHVVGSPSVKSGRKTRGHRFLAPRGKRSGTPFSVSSFRELKQGLKRHYVLLDPQERRERMEKQLRSLEKKARARRAPGLSAELVAELVEWPGAVLGMYPREFESLPREVRHTVLIHHQHYFPLERKPAFIAVTNMASDPKGFIRKGCERVVIARLRDAKFFWDEDLKKPLAERESELDGVLFQAKLGTYKKKIDRMVPLCAYIASHCGARDSSVRRAVSLAKCDLVTGMVGEFPELQGIMGGLYAKEQGEPESVWKAVYSHYSPQGSGDDDAFPLNREGAVVALADKLDTVAAMFAAGSLPTGSRDPFGLRRAALGVIRILLDSGERLEFPMDLTLGELLREALRIVSAQLDSVDENAEAALGEFFAERLRYVFGRDYRYDEINAVLAAGALDLPVTDLAARLEAVRALRGSADFEALSSAFKRVGNILSKQTPGEVQPAVFVEDAERALHQAVSRIEPEAGEHIEARRYREALKVLSGLRKPVDQFFVDVLVMSDDARMRDNRLALLEQLRSLFIQVADLSQIVGGNEER